MENLLTRRLALFRIGSIAGATAVAAAPVAIAAMPTKRIEETPELTSLGHKLIDRANHVKSWPRSAKTPRPG